MSTQESSKPAAENQPLTLPIIKWYGNKVAMTDHDVETHLSLYCYTKCTPDTDDIVKSCRGVVFQGEKLVMQAFPYTQEFSDQDTEAVTALLTPVFDKCRFFTSEEGSLIRMFAVQREDGTYKWFTTTHRKLDAFRSRWASRKSFGTAFTEALEEETRYSEEFKKRVENGQGTLLERFQQNCLDPSVQYMFLVRHSEQNRIVCKAPSAPRVFHVGSFKNGELNFDPICVPMPREHKFSNVQELLDYVRKMDYTRHQGIIVFAPGNKQYKIFQSDYYNLFMVRGNEPSIKFRYLQLRTDENKVRDLMYLYPEMRETFNTYERYLQEISRNIYDAYVNRFIKKQFVSMPAEDFAVMKELHTWHEQDRVKNRVSFFLVAKKLDEQHPTNLNRMIHRLVEEYRNIDQSHQQQVESASQPGLLPTPNEYNMERRGGRGRGGYRGRGGNPRMLPSRNQKV